MSDIIKKLHNKKLSSRAKVILVIEEILHGKSLSILLDELLVGVDEQNRSFVHELTLGTLRHWWALSRIHESLIEKAPTDHGVVAALNIGLYQLLYMNTAHYAAINDTVESLKSLDKGYGAGLVNAVLRKVQKSAAKYQKKVQKNHSLPNWLAKQLKQDWTEYYDKLGVNLRYPAPIFLRVNTRKISTADYSQLLINQNIAHTLMPLGLVDATTIRLDEQMRITALPHFADGYASVQDMHAQLTAYLLADYLPKSTDDTPDNHPKRVLDMCCAPGGKTAQLLEMFHMKHLTAIDNDAHRLKRVHENLSRLGLDGARVSIVTADGMTWQADEPFDVVVLDAPCTATGVIRRHPDIALLRSADDVINTAELQRQILENTWRQLKTGGVLLYVTCSILKVENEQQLSSFLANHSDAKAVPFTLNLPNQIAQSVGYQCLPIDAQGGDGFYYALLEKVA